ncbi:glycosyltransferase family 1 protein [Leptolyngbya sp. FACHB-36]|uniref:glycosyltransferase n=1 Tax=Leptolyngbya sp. FACHB-36 TaxID=2692808 RepID=UPI0016813519|nr:glycosyltransferase [Leptolyngbya sp. FACHB-36]MBD2020133.1 glycosyltransferase family 1 protein [Leptolyngbya sp. FACHB-36]
MNIYVLSDRGMCSSVSYDPLFELEDILAQTCSATILAPLYRSMMMWAQSRSPLLAKGIARTIGVYESTALPKSSDGPNVLLMVLPFSARLQLLSSIPNWRSRFDVVAAYIFDAWSPEAYPSVARQLDHIFVPMPEIVNSIQSTLEVPVSLLPFASDVLTYGCGRLERTIDVISYGRIPPAHHLAFANAFDAPDSSRVYYRSTPRPGHDFAQVIPSDQQRHPLDTQQLYQRLQTSKLALAYDTLYPGMRQFPYSFVTLRWFQCGAAGCAVVGKRPTTPLADELLDWKDSTIDLPDDPCESVDFIHALLQDTPRLHAIHQRNYLRNLDRHDWRHRLQTLLTTLGLPLPHALAQQLDDVRSRHHADALKSTVR